MSIEHPDRVTAVLDVRGLYWASEQNVVTSVLGRSPGVLAVEVNAVAQTATVTFDPGRTNLAQLRDRVRDCGYHCAGQSVPNHICDPMQPPPHHGTTKPESPPSPHEMMGHGGHAGTSMASMVADMRNRFLVAALFSVPILVWSPIGHDVFRLNVPVPFGLRQDVWALLLSLPVIFYAAWIFFDGAVRALRARTLDMMVFVAVAIGSGWLYSVYVTVTGGGDVFYEAATVLAAFVLLGHWFEMRARGGARDAIRTLLDLAPPMAVVIRGGEPVEVPTGEVKVNDLLLVRPGAKIAADGVVEEGEVRSRRVNRDRGKPAGAQRPTYCGSRRRWRPSPNTPWPSRSSVTPTNTAVTSCAREVFSTSPATAHSRPSTGIGSRPATAA